MATNTRAYAAAHFALELDPSGPVGLFRSIEGGSIKADVMTYQNGGIQDRWKQIGKPKFEDIKVQCGMAMGAPFLGWIKSFFSGEPERKHGAIVAADFYYQERARREFRGALIKEVTIPKLDGQDKNAAYLTVGFAVEDLEFKPGTGKKIEQQQGGFDTQKSWTSCNFLFELRGFETACKRTTKIDSFTIKQNILEYHSGGMRTPLKVPSSQVEYPNITFYVPESDAAPFHDHAMNRTVKGATPALFTGAIHVQDNALKDLFSLKLHNVDIVSVTPDRSESTSEEIKQVKIELSIEKIEFEASPGMVGKIG